MQEKTIITRCSSPKEKCYLCWECKRNSQIQHEDETVEDFPIRESRMNGWDCSGYMSKREQDKGLFDE